MKILVFDPLYSSVGHFHRYNRYILSILENTPHIEEIIYISNDGEGLLYEKLSSKVKSIDDVSDINSAQLRFIETKGIARIRLHLVMVREYLRIIKYINKN